MKKLNKKANANTVKAFFKGKKKKCTYYCYNQGWGVTGSNMQESVAKN